MQRFVLFVSLLCLGALVQSQNVGGTTGPCSAFAIPPPYTKPLTVFGATPGASSTSSSSCDISSNGPTVWYTITPTEGATVNLTTCNPGTNFDTVISVYTGSCNSLRCLAYNDDASCTHNNVTGGLSTLSFVPSANTIYFIGVGGYSTNQGSFQLTVSQVNSTTSNTGCSAATNVTGPYSPEITVFGSNVNASTGFSNSQCGIVAGQHTVFYHISPIVGIPMTISTCNPATNFDTVIAVFNGTSCNNLGCFASNDDNCTAFSGYASEIAFTPTSTSYFVTVSGYNTTAQGSFEISFSQEGGGANQCANALVVFSGNIYYGSTVGAPAVVSEPCGVLSNHPTVWYKLNLNSFNTVTVTTCSSATDFDTYIVVLSGQCNSLSCVAYNDDYTCSAGSSTTSRVSFTPNQSSYYILVSGYGLNAGNYELTISQ